MDHFIGSLIPQSGQSCMILTETQHGDVSYVSSYI